MDPKTLALLIAALMGHPRAQPHTRAWEAAAQRTFLIREAVRTEQAEAMRRWRKGSPRPEPVPSDIVAVTGAAEGSLRLDAPDGAAGEIGTWQVKPDGFAKVVCPDLIEQLRVPRINALCAVRLLRWARESCGGDPSEWLVAYNAPARCGRADYTSRVLRRLEQARAALGNTKLVGAVGGARARAVTSTAPPPSREVAQR